jgi:hypothetical protein
LIHNVRNLFIFVYHNLYPIYIYIKNIWLIYLNFIAYSIPKYLYQNFRISSRV